MTPLINSPDNQKIEDAFYSRPEWTETLFLLRDIILQAHPAMVQWHKYNACFFGIKKNICYLNPKADGSCIDIGFMDGKMLTNNHPDLKNFLSGEKLKTVQHFKIYPQPLNQQIIDELNYVLEMAITYQLGHKKF